MTLRLRGGTDVRDWTFWEWVAYVALFVAALEIALKDAPTLRTKFPRLLAGPFWPFVPISLVLFSTAILLAHEFGLLGSQRNVTREEKPVVQAPVPAKPTVKTAEQPREQPPSNPPSVASRATERIFVGTTVTPEFLTKESEKFTEVQKPLFTEPYIGKWMKVSGKVGGIEARSMYDFSTAKVDETISVQFREGPNVIMSFEKSWLERLRLLRQGDQITVVGKIKFIGGWAVSLESCEIVEGAR